MLCIIISSVVISFSALVIRNIEVAGPVQVNFYRAIALFGVISVFLLLRFRQQTFSVIYNIGVLGCVGGIFLGLAGIAFLQALAYTTVANTLFILGAIPFFAALLARILLKEKLARITLLTMLVAALGLAVMVAGESIEGSAIGNGFAMTTALLFALYAVILRGKRKTDMLPTLLVSALFIIIISLIMQANDLVISLHDMVLSFFLGGILSGVGNFLFIYASRHLATAEITLFMLLEFSLGPLWVWLFLNEEPSKWSLIGGVVVIFAVALRAVHELIKRNDLVKRNELVKLNENREKLKPNVL